MFVGEEPLDLERTYTIAMSAYLAQGGDGFPRRPYQAMGQTIRSALRKQMQQGKEPIIVPGVELSQLDPQESRAFPTRED